MYLFKSNKAIVSKKKKLHNNYTKIYKFTILTKGRSIYHLSILESLFIKNLKPKLCSHKSLFTVLTCINYYSIFF